MALKIDQQLIRYGIIGSLVGGVVFGMMMHMMDMMGMVAMLVRSENVWVGWLVHLAISTIFGVIFGVLLANLTWHPIGTGVAWGLAAWMGGALVAMPIMLGMPEMVFNLSGSTPWFSMMGHVMYGFVAGLVVVGLQRRGGPSAQN